MATFLASNDSWTSRLTVDTVLLGIFVNLLLVVLFVVIFFLVLVVFIPGGDVPLKKISEMLCEQYFGIRCNTMMDGKLEGQICTRVREQAQAQAQAQMRDAIGALR
jgi:hypothetical protein